MEFTSNGLFKEESLFNNAREAIVRFAKTNITVGALDNPNKHYAPNDTIDGLPKIMVSDYELNDLYDDFAEDCLTIASYMIGVDGKIGEREIEMANELFKGYIHKSFSSKLSERKVKKRFPTAKNELENLHWVPETLKRMVKYFKSNSAETLQNVMDNTLGVYVMSAVLIAGADAYRTTAESDAVGQLIGNCVGYIRANTRLDYVFSPDLNAKLLLHFLCIHGDVDPALYFQQQPQPQPRQSSVPGDDSDLFKL